MTDAANTSVSTEIEVPLPGTLTPIKKQKNGVVDIKPAVHAAIKDTETAKKVVAYLKKPIFGIYHQGGYHYDKDCVTEIIVDRDTVTGAAIINSKLNRKQIVDSVYVVLRQYYELDKHGKYIGLNTNNFTLLK